MRNRAASKTKMSGSEKKIKANRNTSNKIVGEHIRQFLHKMICSAGSNVELLLIRYIDFHAVLIALAVQQ